MTLQPKREIKPGSRIVVLHSGYGCDTGCCGHIIEVNGEEVGGFNFDHPWDEDHRKWAEQLIRKEFGDEHVADLDWENCIVSED